MGEDCVNVLLRLMAPIALARTLWPADKWAYSTEQQTLPPRVTSSSICKGWRDVLNFLLRKANVTTSRSGTENDMEYAAQEKISVSAEMPSNPPLYSTRKLRKFHRAQSMTQSNVSSSVKVFSVLFLNYTSFMGDTWNVSLVTTFIVYWTPRSTTADHGSYQF